MRKTRDILLDIAKGIFAGLFIAVFLFGLPFAWILKDGLGPDMVGSNGFESIRRWLMTFYIGPVLVGLAMLTAACHAAGKRT